MTNYLKVVFFSLLLLTGILVMSVAANAEALQTISMIADQADGGWHQSYESHGRLIEVNIPITVPTVDKMPIVTCEDWIRFDKSWRDSYFGTQATITEEGTYVGVESTRLIDNDAEWKDNKLAVEISKNVSIALIFNDESLKIDRGHSKDKLERIYSCYYPWELEFDSAYAEDNPLTIKQAEVFLADLLYELYGEQVPFKIHWVDTMSRGRITNGLKNTNDAKIAEYFPLGTYAITCNQTFHGIPIIQRGWEKTKGEWPWLAEAERLGISMTDTDSWAFGASLKKEKSVILEDIPLVSIHKVIEQIEALIASGNIRDVYSLELGYCMFLDPEIQGTYWLYPVWKVECSYMDSAKQEIKSDDSIFTVNAYRYRSDFETLVFNAQTAEIFDKDLRVQYSDFYCPNIITW